MGALTRGSTRVSCPPGSGTVCGYQEYYFEPELMNVFNAAPWMEPRVLEIEPFTSPFALRPVEVQFQPGDELLDCVRTDGVQGMAKTLTYGQFNPNPAFFADSIAAVETVEAIVKTQVQSVWTGGFVLPPSPPPPNPPPSPLSPPSPPSSPPPPQEQVDGSRATASPSPSFVSLATGPIGISSMAVVFLIICVVVALFVWRKKRQSETVKPVHSLTEAGGLFAASSSDNEDEEKDGVDEMMASEDDDDDDDTDDDDNDSIRTPSTLSPAASTTLRRHSGQPGRGRRRRAQSRKVATSTSKSGSQRAPLRRRTTRTRS